MSDYLNYLDEIYDEIIDEFGDKFASVSAD